VTTAIQFCLLSISAIFEATVFFYHLVNYPLAVPLSWKFTAAFLIGASLLPVLVVLRHGTPGPRMLASGLAIIPAVYIYGQVSYWLQG
jgi:hypothetical protein